MRGKTPFFASSMIWKVTIGEIVGFFVGLLEGTFVGPGPENTTNKHNHLNVQGTSKHHQTRETPFIFAQI